MKPKVDLKEFIKADIIIKNVIEQLKYHNVFYHEPVLSGSFVLHAINPSFRKWRDIDVIIHLESYQDFISIPRWFSEEYEEYKIVRDEILLSFKIEYVNIIFKIGDAQRLMDDRICGYKCHTPESILHYKELLHRDKDIEDINNYKEVNKMKTIEVKGITYKIITKEYQALGDYNDGELFVENFIAAHGGIIWGLSRRVEHIGYDEDYNPTYKYGEWKIGYLCSINALKD